MIVRLSDWAWMPLVEYPAARLDRLKKRLTVKPRRTSKHQEADDLMPVELFRLQDGMIGVPRAFFLKNVTGSQYEVKDERSVGRPIDVSFNGELIKDQPMALEAFRRHGGGILQAAPGWGKTALAIACWLDTKCNGIVIVHKEFLVNQWVKRIKGDPSEGVHGFAPSARVGVIQGDKCEFGEDFDISIATIQSLVARIDSYPKEMWSAFGFAVFDEVHIVGAQGWSRVAPLITAKIRLGLSARPERKDEMDPVFLWNIGDVIYVSRVKRVIPTLRRIYTGFYLKPTSDFDPNNASKEIQLRFLCKSPKRNELIVSELKKAVEAGRKIMVMSGRRKHLEWLSVEFSKVKPEGCVTDFYVGQRKQEDLDKAEKANVIFCTYAMAKEALDIPDTDTLFLTTPMADVEQAVGRIMREHDNKKDPVVTDFIDDKVASFAQSWKRRLAFYKDEGMFHGEEDR